MDDYWISTKSPVHMFPKAYESAELAKELKENSFVDPAVLALDLKTPSLSQHSIMAYQRRLGVRKIAESNPRGKR